MVATIYNTSLLVKKSGTSVDVKVDVKNVMKGREWRGGELRGGERRGPGLVFYYDVGVIILIDPSF